MVTTTSERIGLIEPGLGGQQREAALLEQRGRAIEQRRIARCDARGMRGAGPEERALPGFGQLDEPPGHGVGVTEPRDVVQQRGLHRRLAQTSRVIGRDAQHLARRRQASPLAGEPRVGTVDVGVEQAALADLELGHPIEVDSCALAVTFEQLAAGEEGERPAFGRAEPESP